MSFALDQSLQNIETTLNIVGYIPFVSIASGSIRFVGGKVEAIAGLILAALSALPGGCQSAKEQSRRIDHGLELALHGGANMIRGAVESIPVIGNLGCMLYDLSNRMEYSSLRPTRFVIVS
jgi:hypothetical protein